MYYYRSYVRVLERQHPTTSQEEEFDFGAMTPLVYRKDVDMHSCAIVHLGSIMFTTPLCFFLLVVDTHTALIM